MAAVIEALGLGALGLSMIPLAQDFFPAPYKATTVGIVGITCSRTCDHSGEQEAQVVLES